MEPPRFLAVFNQPPPKLPTGRRDATNVPSQALALLNDPFVLEQARVWGGRVVGGPERSIGTRVMSVFRTALGRAPSADEQALWEGLVSDLARDLGVPPDGVLASVPLWAGGAPAPVSASSTARSATPSPIARAFAKPSATSMKSAPRTSSPCSTPPPSAATSAPRGFCSPARIASESIANRSVSTTVCENRSPNSSKKKTSPRRHKGHQDAQSRKKGQNTKLLPLLLFFVAVFVPFVPLWRSLPFHLEVTSSLGHTHPPRVLTARRDVAPIQPLDPFLPIP